MGRMNTRGSEPAGGSGELANLVLGTTADTFRFYLELAPDGSPLDEREAAATLERLEQGASCGRVVDMRLRCATVQRDEAQLIRATMVVLRAMQHSLLLTLSGDDSERARAMPVTELKDRMQPVHARWLASGQGGRGAIRERR